MSNEEKITIEDEDGFDAVEINLEWQASKDDRVKGVEGELGVPNLSNADSGEGEPLEHYGIPNFETAKKTARNTRHERLKWENISGANKEIKLHSTVKMDTTEISGDLFSELEKKEKEARTGESGSWSTEEAKEKGEMCALDGCEVHTEDYVEGLDGEMYCALDHMREARNDSL